MEKKRTTVILLAIAILVIFSGENIYRYEEGNTLIIFPAVSSFHLFNDEFDARDTQGLKMTLYEDELRSLTVSLFLAGFINILTEPTASFRYSQGLIMKILDYAMRFVHQYTEPIRRNIGKIISYAINTLNTLYRKIGLIIRYKFIYAHKVHHTLPSTFIGKAILSCIISTTVLRL